VATESAAPVATLNSLYKCLISLITITAALAIGTLLFHFNSAFYRKGEFYERTVKQIKEKKQEAEEQK
jgi:hypothetical protein